MVKLAIADNPHFVLSLAETHEDGYTYTKETLERLTREHPDTDYYFIMGADSLFSFETWKEPQGSAICVRSWLQCAMTWGWSCWTRRSAI